MKRDATTRIKTKECEAYYGRRSPAGPTVHVRCPDDPHFPYPLHLRHDLAVLSVPGFEWGYCGSGPAQLSLALLARATSNDRAALNLHQEFKADVVSLLSEDGWLITQRFILRWMSDKIRSRS